MAVKLPQATDDAQGVLPAPGADYNTSASQNFAEGGGVIDEDPIEQDSGNAAQPVVDPFGLVKQALNYGRKKMGLPESFYGQQNKTLPLEKEPSQSEALPEEQAFAEGGAVEDEGEQGVIPSEPEAPMEQAAPQGPNPEAAMAYLSGQGGVGPDIAQALEQQVDPQGGMDPNMRKMLALGAAGDPDKAFQVLQHYRQKFNAYNAVAKAAMAGAGGRPPDIGASAHAATQAYQNLPDGKALQFSPVNGGMRVSIRDAMQQQAAAAPQEQAFEEGGAVEDENPDAGVPGDMNVETAGASPWAGSSYDVAKQAEAAAPIKEPGRGPHDAIRDFVLSIPQYLGWLSKEGQADSVFDLGVDATLEAASKSPMSPMAGAQGMGARPQPQAPAPQAQQQQAPQEPPIDQGVTSQRPQDPRVAQMNADPMSGGREAMRPTPRDPEAFGAAVGDKLGAEGANLSAVLHEIDQAYPTVGMSQQRAIARANARQHWNDGRHKIEAEQTKGAAAMDRAVVAGGARRDVANINQGGANQRNQNTVAGRVQGIETQQAGANQRNQNTVAGRKDVAQTNQQGQNNRFTAREQNLNDRAIITNKPSAIGSPEAMDKARKAIGPGAQLPQGGQQAQAPAQQQPQEGTGPAPMAPPPAGMKYQENKAKTKWRLVPAQ